MEKKEYKGYGEFLYEERIKSGLTLREYCYKHNLDPVVVSHIEADQPLERIPEGLTDEIKTIDKGVDTKSQSGERVEKEINRILKELWSEKNWGKISYEVKDDGSVGTVERIELTKRELRKILRMVSLVG